MKTWKSIGASAVFMTLVSSTATWADVTAQEVWADWNDYMNGFGYQVTAQQTMAGDTLTITDFTATLALPNDAGTLKATLSDLALKNRGDGTVSVTLPQHNPIVLDVTSKDGKPVHLELDYYQTGLAMIVSGTTDKMTYASTATELGVKLINMTVDGKSPGKIAANLNIGNFLNNYTTTITDMRRMESTSNIGSLTYNIAVDAPDGTGSFKIDGTLEGMTSSFKGAFPAAIGNDIDHNDVSAMLKAGLAMDGAFTYKAGNSEFSGASKGKTSSGSSSSGGGSLEFAMDQNQLHYGLSSKDAEVTFSSSDIPFPSLTLKLAEYAVALTLPVAKTETPQKFSFLIKLVDFALPKEIWMMGDPKGVLPHDPATVIVDLSGKAKWFFNLLDPKAQAEMANKVPGEIDSLKLNALEVKAAGADLTGTGAFTFDNSDKVTFGGAPKPTGAIDLKLVGGNALLDKLVQMGLMPEDQATGFRMMSGMFAKAGDGPDTLVSKIEITKDGQILANGQRLK